MQQDGKGKQYLFVIRELVSREIKRKYARSYLGILWSVLNPLLSMAVMSMIFSTIFKRSIENFPIYYLTGSIFWALFTGSTNAAMTALVDNKNMLIKVKLPMSIFPLARSCTALANFGYSLVAYTVMLVIFRVKPNIYMPLIFLYAAGLFLFSLGISYFLSILYVLFGDIKQLY
ncbi:MAG: ABC transporter permease, partial [Lachnospiraceae bacterium]